MSDERKQAASIAHCSLQQIENLYVRGFVSREDTLAYIREWNKGPHFTQAYLMDGCIRNAEPEKLTWLPKRIIEECGVRL